MKETKVYLLDGGSLSLDQSYMFMGAGLTGVRRFPVYSVLVDHADGKFLFDTGFDFGHMSGTVSRRASPGAAPPTSAGYPRRRRYPLAM